MSEKLPCEIVQDLLPSYVDGLTNHITNVAVEEHICECKDCALILDHMRTDFAPTDRKENVQEQQEIDYLKKIRRRSRIPSILLTVILVIILLAGITYLFLPIGTRGEILTKAQRESLCEQIAQAEDVDEYEQYLPTKSAASIKLYGVDRRGNIGYVYGYMSAGIYVKFKGKAYNVSGGNGSFKIKIKYNGKQIKIVKVDYGDGVSESATLEEFPTRYYLMNSIYNSIANDSGFCQFEKKTDKKIEKKWGVKVETKYTMFLEDDGKYEIYNITNDGAEAEKMKTDYQDRGRLKKIK